MHRTAAQPDLFGTAPPHSSPMPGDAPPEAVPAAYLARIRADAEALLARVTDAERLPWPDYTQSALAELRFEGLARWLPDAEAAPLRGAFARELDRLYALEPAPPTA